MRFGRAFIILALGLFTPDATVRGQGPDAAASAGGGTRVRRVVEAARVGGQAPVIDGRLDDPTWAQAAVAGRFIQFAPRPGAPSAQRTEARVLFDEQAIYVGMRLFDTAPDSIAGQLARRDLTGGYNDWAQVVIDSYNDRRTAFRFGVNPRGVQKDVFHYNDREEGVGWDAVWESATQLDSLGWTAEFRIPLSQLRFSARGRAEQGGEQVWGIQFIRDIARSSERSYWSPNSPDVPGFVSQFGELRGIRGVASPGRIELVPYSVARMTAAPGDDADPFHRENDFAGSLGADLKYGVTSDLTLTATINPDFGQVEADPSQVNLTAFETFFEERRPFFVEGSDIFRFDIAFPYFVRGAFFRNDQPFYPRRVGRTPQGDVPDEAIYSDAPDATTILGAAKLSGKTASGWSIGVLEAVTADERARYTDSLGVRQRVLLEPLTNYAVVRPIKDFRQGQSAIGGIVTATNRSLDDVTAEFLRSGAYTAGVDVRHQFGTDGKYQLKGAVLASHVRGSAKAISDVQLASGHFFDRPDADHLDYDSTRTSLTGVAADIKF